MTLSALLQSVTPSEVADLGPFLDRVYAGTAVRDWIVASCVFVGAIVVFALLKRLTLVRLAQWAERTETDLDDLVIDLVRRTSRFYLIALAARIASHWLTLSSTTHGWLSKAAILATFIQVGLWGLGIVHYGLQRLVKDRPQEDPIRTMGASILGMIGRGIVWITVLLLCLGNLGVDVTALITGLGVGGIAVALALQNILGDLFASITILLDKPFVVGDAITLGEFVGTVEEIGIKTTRLRSVNGEQIVVGNSDLVNSRIRNFKRLAERRSVFTLGVNYSTPYAELEAIPGMLKDIVETTPHARFDRAHFKSFGDWALIFEVVYFSTRPEYHALMDVQQGINLEIKRRFEARGIQMAFPTQTVIHQGAVEAPRPGARN
ncbi:MAG: mechanosensitive ion channel family protein [Planctomycetes bacterium]|nr:mechanosensitive ion channel family protein [Planctomycetota bacterium]